MLDWRSSHPAEDPDEEAAQMLEAANALRRKRGVAERTEDDVRKSL